MNDKLKAAAERLRVLFESGCEVRSVYGEDYEHDYSDDITRIAIQYLAEHPADDDEPIGEWWYATLSDSFKLLEVKWSPAELWIEFAGWALTVKSNPTKGDVRRLCAALGVTLEAKAEA